MKPDHLSPTRGGNLLLTLLFKLFPSETRDVGKALNRLFLVRMCITRSRVDDEQNILRCDIQGTGGTYTLKITITVCVF